MEELFELIKKRRSIRKYSKEPVKKEDVLKIIEAGSWAPSASNNQPWRFIVITDRELIRNIGGQCTYFSLNNFVKEASLIVVMYTERKHRWTNIDCGMCAQNMMLEAYSLGIGSCFIGAYRERKVKEILNLPQAFKIVGIITFGYISEKPLAPSRIPAEELVKWEKYSKENSLHIRKATFRSGMLSLVSRFFMQRKK